MTLEHADTIPTPCFNYMALALVGKLFYEEGRDGDCLRNLTAPYHKPSARGDD